jgi:hypothetical protein
VEACQRINSGRRTAKSCLPWRACRLLLANVSQHNMTSIVIK